MQHRGSSLSVSAEWHCRSCASVFDTRGKRDNHHRQEHQKVSITITDTGMKQQLERSESGNFKCPCGNVYLTVGALNKHWKKCKINDDILNTRAVENMDLGKSL